MFADIFQRYADRTLFQCDDGTHFTYSSVLNLSLLPAIQDARGQLVFCLCANVPGALFKFKPAIFSMIFGLISTRY